jgi:hypothetical protein
VNIGMHWGNVVQGECDAVIVGGMDIVEGVQCRLHVTSHQFIGVGRKKRVNRGEVRTCIT